MSSVRETIGGCWQLVRLAWISRFNLRGPYWQWREHTAFGEPGTISPRARRHALMDYARWVHRMRRQMRG